MDSPHLLASNLQALVDAKVVTSAYALAKKALMSQSALGRVLKAQGAAQLNTLDSIADALHMRPCDLLDPALKSLLASGQVVRLTAPRPPVVSEEEWRSLSPMVRALVEEIVSRASAGELPDTTARWLHEAVRIGTAPPVGDGPPRATAAGEQAFAAAERLASTPNASSKRPTQR